MAARARAGSTASTLLARLVQVEPHEVTALLWSFAYFFSLLCAYSSLKPIRDEMGIAGGVRNLQWLFTATFVGTLLAVPAFSAVAARFPRRRFVPWVYRFCALTLLAFWAAWRAEVGPVLLARAFFVWVSVFNLFITSVFWAFMADVFRADQGKRLFGFVAAGGTVGAMVGPLVSAAVAPALGPAALLPISALVFEAAARCARRVARSSGPDAATTRTLGEAVGGHALSGVALLSRSRYLLGIGAQTLLHAVTSTILYAQYLSLAEGALADPGRRVALFGLVESGTNLVALGLQVAVTGRVLSRFGLAAALGLLPALSAAGFLGLAAAPILPVVVAFHAARRSAHFAVERPAREVLFTPVSPGAKYMSKSFIDTVVYRGGDAVSGWLNAALAAAGLATAGVAVAALPVTYASYRLARFLARRHGEQVEAAAPSRR